MRSILVSGIGIVFLALGMVDFSHADRRSYVWTYEYITMPRGHMELEHYVTLEMKDLDESEKSIWKHWAEVEYGITDRWDVSIYHMFRQERVENLRYDGVKVRTRYRFFETGDMVLDPLVYLEYKRKADLGEKSEFEGKVILARDFGKANIALNLIGETEFEDGEMELEPEYALGIGYQVRPQLKLGLEFKGGKEQHYVSPAISLASGELWFTVGTAFGLTADSDDLNVRTLMGIGF